jgi:hypothetical protein
MRPIAYLYPEPVAGGSGAQDYRHGARKSTCERSIAAAFAG